MINTVKGCAEIQKGL